MAFTYIQLGESGPSSSSPISSNTNIHDSAGNNLTSTAGALDVNIDNADIQIELSAADGDNLAIKDVTGTNALSISAAGAAKVDGSAVTQPISAAALPLPSGASTEATLAAIKAKTDNLDVALSTRTKPADSQHVTVDNSTITSASNFETQVDTFTSTGDGVTIDVSTSPTKYYTMVVKSTGALASLWDVRLEGSLDGTNFSQILQHTNTTGDGAVLFIGDSVAPALYFRSRCAGLTLNLATNIVVTVLGTN